MKVRFLITTEVREDGALFSRYATLAGEPVARPEPGDVFWSIPHVTGGHPCTYWDNCSGRHLIAVLPNGHWWNIDARASNCTLPDDRQHRCWVRHGSAADGTLHVDKGGLTCNAGAGSIAVQGYEGCPAYHGFLHHGAFT